MYKYYLVEGLLHSTYSHSFLAHCLLWTTAAWETGVCTQVGKPTASDHPAGASTAITFIPVGNFDQKYMVGYIGRSARGINLN